jgi:protein SCO1
MGLGLFLAQVMKRVLGADGLLGAKGQTPAEKYAYGNRTGEGLGTLFPVPQFELTNQQGASISTASLKGRVWIADFFFTSCRTACPILTSKLVRVQRHLVNSELRFVSFSVDPEHDDRAALQTYAGTWAPAELRWELLQTTRESLSKLADGMHVAVEARADDKDPILHSSLFFLMDPEGMVRGTYDSNDEVALARLEADARLLLRQTQVPLAESKALPADGKALYETLKCDACHNNPDLAPTLSGMAGRKVTLADGAVLEANAEYVAESIREPGKKQVAGFLNIMPAYGGELSSVQLSALTQYVLGLSGGTTVNSASATIVIDPVCGMQVRDAPSAPHVRHAGHDYAFCSEACAERFRKKPASFLKQPATP